MKERLSRFLLLPEGGQKTDDKTFIKKMTCSIVLILLLMVGMSFSAVAYFSTDIVNDSNRIRTAAYQLELQVSQNGTLLDVSENTLTLEGGKTYQVTLKYQEGSASTGYCLVTVGDRAYHTQQIGADAKAQGGKRLALNFSMEVNGQGTVKAVFAPQWGTSGHYQDYEGDGPGGPLYITESETLDLGLNNGRLVDLLTEHVSQEGELLYTVQEGDTLEKIAMHYGTSYQRLAAYNQLANADAIAEGQQLKIPPEEWEAPSNVEEVPQQEEPQQEEPLQEEPTQSEEPDPEALPQDPLTDIVLPDLSDTVDQDTTIPE